MHGSYISNNSWWKKVWVTETLQSWESTKVEINSTVLSSLLCRLAPYRGWFPVICSLCCSNFVYFYCFHSLKASWLKGKQSSSSVDLALGIAAGWTSRQRLAETWKVGAETCRRSVCLGVVNVLATTPLWVVNTRLKLQGSKFRSADIQPTNYAGIFGKTPVTLSKLEPPLFHLSSLSNFAAIFVFSPDAFYQIVRDEGVGALWNGTFPSLLLVLNPAIQFMIYEGLKRQLKKGIPREVSERRD